MSNEQNGVPPSQPPYYPYGMQPPPLPSNVFYVTAKDRDAAFSAGGGAPMLILCLMYTAYYLFSVLAGFSWLFFADYVLEFFVLLALWLIFGFCAARKANTTGLSFLRFFVVFRFVLLLLLDAAVLTLLAVLAFLLMQMPLEEPVYVDTAAASSSADIVANLYVVIGCIVLVAAIAGILLDVFRFRSLHRCLGTGSAILGGSPTRGKRSGNFAAVMMIIDAVFFAVCGAELYFNAVLLAAVDVSAFPQLAETWTLLSDYVLANGAYLAVGLMLRAACSVVQAAVIFRYNALLSY